jgi:hypothetical protein
MKTSTRFGIVVGVGLLATACRYETTKAPPGIHFPRKAVEPSSTLLSAYPVRIDRRFVADRSLDDLLDGPAFDAEYRVRWRFEVLGSPTVVTRSRCEASPDGDVYIHGKKLDEPAIACTPQGKGPWMVLERGCRRGRVGYGASELLLNATISDRGEWEGHYVFRRDDEVVAAIEIFTTPGTQGVWERDGLSVDDRAAIAFTTNALEWVSEPLLRDRICR